jgi:hypothetical protein
MEDARSAYPFAITGLALLQIAGQRIGVAAVLGRG